MTDTPVATDLTAWLKQFEDETHRFLRDIPEVKESVNHLTAATERMALSFEKLDERDRDAVPLRTHYISLIIIASPCVLFIFSLVVLLLFITNRDLSLTSAGLELKTVVQQEHEKTQRVLREKQNEIANKVSEVLKNKSGIKQPIEVEIVGDQREDGGKGDSEPVGTTGLPNADKR